MEPISQAIMSYITVVVLLNVVSASFYIFSPALRVKALRSSVYYFCGFYFCMAVGFIVYASTFPKLTLVGAIWTNTTFLLSFYLLKYGFATRQSISQKHIHQEPYAFVNLTILLIVNVGILYSAYESNLLRTALLTTNCSIIAVFALKYIPKQKLKTSYGEKLAMIGIGLTIVFSVTLLMTLKLTEDMFAYLSMLMVCQSIIALLLLGGTLTIFLSDLSDMYYQESVTDELSGLFNRRFFLRQSEAHIKAAKRHDFPISIILCDIDFFKRINDNHGHHVGDRIIMEFAQILRDSSRDSDILARFGGEEFIILLPQTGLEGAMALAERMRSRTEAFNLPSNPKTVQFTASFGVATFEKDTDLESNIKRADTALYRAKSSGRNKVFSSTVA